MAGRLQWEAHRGVSTEYPENTRAAFRAAADLGYDMIELDPRFTADARCVILHDETVNRTGRTRAGGRLTEELPVFSLSLNELRDMDFGIWFAPRFAGERLPTLEEVLEFSLEKGIPLKFDNKAEEFPAWQQDLFFDAADRIGLHPQSGYTGRTLSYLRKVAGRLPHAQLHYDGPLEKALLQELRETAGGRLTIWAHVDTVTEELAAAIKQYGRLGLWLLTNQDQLQAARDRYDADIIETDGSLKPADVRK